MTQKLIKIGNSLGTIVPAEIIKKFGLKKGDAVDVNVQPTGLSKKGTTITPEFKKWLEKFNKEYGRSLQELANK